MKKKPNGYWTLQSTTVEAKKYKTLIEFKTNSGGAHSAANKNGWMAVATRHMTPSLRKIKWDTDAIDRFAKKCKTKSEFESRFPNAYNAAIKKKVMHLVSKHMYQLQKPHRYWTPNRILAAAKKYSTIGDFRDENLSAYSAAKRLKLLPKLRKVLARRVPKYKWTLKSIAIEAKKYKTKNEFRKKSPGAYSAAHKKKIIDSVTAHMDPMGNRFKRAIYAFEFPEKMVYVGLTFDFEARLKGHKKAGQLKARLRRSGWKFRRFEKWYDPKTARNKEADKINWYVVRGWTPLNRAKAGALGGGPIQWGIEEIRRVARKCQTREEFRTKYWGAAQVAYQNGWIEEICGHLPRVRAKRNHWPWISIKKIARKYKDYKSFIRENRNLYATVQRRGELGKLKKLF